MKSFRHILVTALLTLVAFGAVLYSSCKSKCGSTTCQNGGTCDDNVCICPIGYSGNACQTGWSTAILGTYNCSRANCVPRVAGVNSWQSSITTDATNGGYTIDISNFDNSGGATTVVGTIDSAIQVNSDLIQTITVNPGVGSYGVNASGTYNVTTSIVNMTFTVSSIGGVGGYQCSMVMTKIL